MVWRLFGLELEARSSRPPGNSPQGADRLDSDCGKYNDAAIEKPQQEDNVVKPSRCRKSKIVMEAQSNVLCKFNGLCRDNDRQI